jgi:hypothetical protein
MKGRRFAVLIGLCVAAVGTNAFASGAAAGPAPVRSQTTVWTNTSGVQQPLPAASKEMRALVQQAARALQSKSDDDDNGDHKGNYQQCTGGTITPDDPDTPAFEQTCTITAAKGTCVQRSSKPVVEQRCTFTQTSPAVGGTTLSATAIQIHNPEGGPNGTQDAIQVIEASQTNLAPGKWDYLYATQIADQCLGLGDNFEDEDGDWNDEDRDGDRDDDGACENGEEEDGDDEEDAEDENGPLFPDPIMQSQRATQTIDAFQKTVGRGQDVANALQIQNLHERSANTDVIDQDQNLVQRDNECGQVATGLGDVLDANACFSIRQESDKAKSAKLLQVYNLFQSARNCCDTGFGLQEQGDPAEDFGGLEHSFDQTPGTGTPTQVSYQVERLTQRRVDTPLMSWHQFAGPRKDVGLQDDPNGRANMTQDIKMFSTGPGFGSQGAFLEIECSSLGAGGNCTGTQRAETNGEGYFDMDSGSSISMVARCNDFESGTECFAVGD